MKKKRFYNSKKRDTKWTEVPQGRKIDFADKYADDGTGSALAPKKRKKLTKAQRRKILKNTVIAVICFAIISVGYIIMDVHIIRHSMPDNRGEDINSGVAIVEISIKATEVQPISFDAGTMLNSVVKDTQLGGYTSIAFDIKRDDGTIGYQSSLATIEAYGAISSPATDLKGSIEIMGENDILPVGRISVYKDNVAARADNANAIMLGNEPYQDEDGYLYLNPDSEGTYSYIKSIVEETKGLGINIFVLDNYDLPAQLGDGYSDGFEAISERLYADFGDEIKLYKAESVDIDYAEYSAIEEKANSFPEDKAVIYYTEAEYAERVKTIYDSKDINYIIK